MRIVKDTKDNVRYKIEDGKIVPSIPHDLSTIFEPIKEGRGTITKSKSSLAY